ncbi:MAG: hypothetical protein EAZ78_02255 [Oscillatoriales cyanobacterium]|nr:MAG: hypothetical protein EAZ78_02255 [Oscillatoriales cyanobacterium]TAF63244.1 MAG: hypothetical protein EAZ59_21350 [Oscillatoriales cyanobacterium]
MKLKLRKYEQALAILPGCKGLDKSVLYDRLKYSGYRWSVGDRRWCVEPFNGLPATDDLGPVNQQINKNHLETNHS